MTEKEFNNFARKGHYHIFIFTCPAMAYFFFARHPRIVVVDDKGNTDRFEITHKKKNGSHLYHNAFKPREGLGRFSLIQQTRFTSKLLGHIHGDKNSQVKDMYNTIKKNIDNYTYKNKYHFFPGPNSNTFIQRLLDKVPEWKIKLPWNGFGKGYK